MEIALIILVSILSFLLGRLHSAVKDARDLSDIVRRANEARASVSSGDMSKDRYNRDNTK